MFININLLTVKFKLCILCSYRLRTLYVVKTEDNTDRTVTDEEIYHNLVDVVNLHQEAIEWVFENWFIYKYFNNIQQILKMIHVKWKMRQPAENE